MKRALNNPLVSAIVPFYNNKGWLREALQSALSQTYQNIEIIVVNDGSPENIDDLALEYPSVTFLRKENGGSATARNLGIEVSHGEYCAFLDSDDLWEEDKIEKQLKYLISSDGIWSATAYETFGMGDHKIVAPFNTDERCYNIIAGSCKIQTSTVMVRSKELRANPEARFADDMRNGQDIFLWLYLATRYNIYVLSEPLTKFRLRKGSTQSSIEAHIRVRALLWGKMKQGILPYPKQTATRVGYSLCDSLYKHCVNDGRASLVAKCIFPLAWLLFRIGSQTAKLKPAWHN